MKTCSKCNQEKPFSEFYRAGRGHRADCKTCFKEVRSSPERAARYKLYRTNWHKKNGHRYICRRKGIEEDDYQRLLAAQGGVCAICEASPPKDKPHRHLDIDHDHQTGKVRGLLCRRCNIAMGFFDAGFFQDAQKYVDQIPSRAQAA